ncbi:hypothetical protein STANM309S_01246 [Streptomyces tanashiensis]
MSLFTMVCWPHSPHMRIVSLTTRPTDATVLANWRARLAGQDPAEGPAPEGAEATPATLTG